MHDEINATVTTVPIQDPADCVFRRLWIVYYQIESLYLIVYKSSYISKILLMSKSPVAKM